MFWKKLVLMLLHLEQRGSKKIGRPNKLKPEAYLDQIYYVLKTGIQWNKLRSELHWSTYYKKYRLWSQNNLFRRSFLLVQKVLDKQGYLNDKGRKNLYIDSSMVKNVKGWDGLGVNHYDRGRKGNKIHLIVNQDGIPLGVKVTGSNVHDVTMVNELVESLKIKIVGSRLIGDKGYCSSRLKNKLKDKGVDLIYPMKKNSREMNNQLEKDLLKRRNVVENVFSWMQNNRHLKLRYDRYKKHYMEFYYLGLIDLIGKKIDL